ncbi:tetratricopeptide repeat protein [Pyrobaculum sp.]|uniref:tetratricopeptide repeat protein n=1 Tax=Pyrobaculum sp. TaxID=2004705 RepID=UPI0038621835
MERDESLEKAKRLIDRGNTYYDHRKYNKAEKRYKRALEILKKRFGDKHPYIAKVLIYLGLVYYRQGKYSNTRDVVKQALEIYKKTIW